MATESENKPEKCLNCGSMRITGPYKTIFRIGFFSEIKHHGFVCIDCGFTMMFTLKRDKQRLIKDAKRKKLMLDEDW